MRNWGVDERITEQLERDKEFLAEQAKNAEQIAKDGAESLASGVKATAEHVTDETETDFAKIVEWFSSLSDSMRERLATVIAQHKQ